jgi:alanine dehydrogenase
MKIGVVKEIKEEEYRVALTPAGASALTDHGHAVVVEEGAGLGSGFADEEYRGAGAMICNTAQAWNTDMVMKVKEPLASEYAYLGQQIVFTYFHLAGVARSLTETLLARGTTAIAYETLEDEAGRLPLLAPMSAVAGNMAALIGGYYLARFNRGKGVQLGRVLGASHGKVVIIGDGVVGRHAARVADSMGAAVFLAGRKPEREPGLKKDISERIHFFLSKADRIARHVEDADLVVGAVLRHGAKAPHVVTAQMVESMQPGSVVVDVSIDQGGCIETSRPTSHRAPVYERFGVIHYCVTNMPGAYPRTSTIALTTATLPYALRLADQGLAALQEDEGFRKAVNTCRGSVTCRPVAEGLDLMDRYKDLSLLTG